VAIFHIVVTLTHNECTGGFLPVGKTHKRNIWSDGNYGEFSLLLLLLMEIVVNYLYYYCRRVVSEVHKIGWILAHRVCGFLNMEPPIKLKLN
jgi:hypothetical protein